MKAPRCAKRTTHATNSGIAPRSLLAARIERARQAVTYGRESYSREEETGSRVGQNAATLGGFYTDHAS